MRKLSKKAAAKRRAEVSLAVWRLETALEIIEDQTAPYWDTVPSQLPPEGSLKAEANFFGIPDRLTEDAFDHIGEFNPRVFDKIPDHFPFVEHGAKADAVMERYVNRSLPYARR